MNFIIDKSIELCGHKIISSIKYTFEYRNLCNFYKAPVCLPFREEIGINRLAHMAGLSVMQSTGFWALRSDFYNKYLDKYMSPKV